MKNKLKKFWLLLVVLTLSLMVFTPVCSGNLAEPPSILIIVTAAPEDMEIILGDGIIKANREDKAFESYFTFYSHELRSSNYMLTVTTGDISFEIRLDEPPQSYNNIYTLDLKTRTLKHGEAWGRSVSLILLRLLLTLLIEAVIFYLFGYRSKKSWLVFLAVNVVTQGILNIWLGVAFIPLNNYMIFALILGEILVLFIELIVFLIFIKERHRLLTAAFVILANLASLLLGGLLIKLLPV